MGDARGGTDQVRSKMEKGQEEAPDRSHREGERRTQGVAHGPDSRNSP